MSSPTKPAPPVRGTCSQNPEHVDRLVYVPWNGRAYEGPPICSDCYRARARAAPLPVQECDRCQGAPAFRDPSHRRNEYLCGDCHAANGYFLGARQLAGNVARSAPTLRESTDGRAGRASVICEAHGYGTECRGEIKPRGGVNVGRSLCSFHNDPKAYYKARQ